MNNYDVSLKGLEDAWHKKDNYIFTKDKNGKNILIEKSTGNAVYDEYLINKYRMVFAWLKAVNSSYERGDIYSNTISENVESLAFGNHGHKIYATLMENIKQQLLNGIDKYDFSSGNLTIQSKRAIENGLDSDGLTIADNLIFWGGTNASSTVNWVSYAIPKLQNQLNPIEKKSVPSNEHDYKEEYNLLLNSRTALPNYNELVKNLKRKAWQHFGSITSTTSLESNMSKNITVYSAPLLKIHGSNLVTWPVANGNEIYIDENFLKDPNNADILVCQIMHEICHSLVNNKKDGVQQFFGHIGDKTEMIGLNEAATQMYAEDITGIRLSEDEDYLILVKTCMRVCKILIGEQYVASQYLGNDLSFENKFNEITGGKFDAFTGMMNTLYNLSKKCYYDENENVEALKIYFDNILKFLKKNFKKQSDVNPEIFEQLKDELGIDKNIKK